MYKSNVKSHISTDCFIPPREKIYNGSNDSSLLDPGMQDAFGVVFVCEGQHDGIRCRDNSWTVDGLVYLRCNKGIAEPIFFFFFFFR